MHFGCSLCREIIWQKKTEEETEEGVAKTSVRKKNNMESLKHEEQF